MIVFAPTALLATSRASSSRPATTRPGRPLSSRRAAACRARGCPPPSRLALHNAPTRRARRGPGRAGAAAARRAVLLFPRGRRASLLGCCGGGELLGCAESFFCGVAVLGCGAANGCSLGARCRGDCKTTNETCNSPVLCFAPRKMRCAAAHRQASSDYRVAPHSSIARRLAEQ